MKREEALHLTNHHYRLYTSIRPVVDCSPPVSMYSSPKSVHYKPFPMRRPASCQALAKKHGKEELNHFLSRKNQEITPINLGFNAFARSTSVLNLSEIKKEGTMNRIQSKLLNSRVYQPPIKVEKPPKPPSQRDYATNDVQYRAVPEKTEQKRRNERLSSHYYRFKDYVLDLIILRGVFTDSVIMECFAQEIEKRTDLDKNKMESIMYDTLADLGVKSSGSEAKRSAAKVKLNVRRSGSLSSLSSGRGSSTPQSSASSKKSKDDYQSDSSTRSNVSNSSQNTVFTVSPVSSKSVQSEELSEQLSANSLGSH
ncbi:unnamed protein product [Bursaphelenchus xylophilus]|uniref:(pine wood nematode) hypothetical protein n=1 Tax=Bursaphelenchus xylophilus TaxID=6326 RepID=A0A1I7RRM9_BURXY|nr:unnamed protein product [Bursaphelenchus xylophilus]CAG9123630.1 unnamed protein product [Bursaphelenchus xylophilus]